MFRRHSKYGKKWRKNFENSNRYIEKIKTKQSEYKFVPKTYNNKLTKFLKNIKKTW